MTEHTTAQPKWTPGPWEYGIRCDGSKWLSLGDSKTGPHFQGNLCGSVDDARLIVSARELYEALAGVIDLIETGVLVRNTQDDGEPGWALRQLATIMKLKAGVMALSKARGEA